MNTDEKKDTEFSKGSCCSADQGGCSCEEEDCSSCGQDCSCGDHQTIIITTDDDREIECSVINIFQAKDKKYIVLLPQDGSSKGEAYLFRFSQAEGGNPELENIEDEAEYAFASGVFENLMNNINLEEEFQS